MPGEDSLLPDLDPAVQENLRELMQDDYLLLLDTFIIDAEKRLGQLRTFLASGDLESFRRCAHSFKGSSGNMGALALQQVCTLAEQAGIHGDAGAAGDALERIEQCYRQLRPQLHP
ncbi:MAG: Hpt domain-containing protein [Halopseudomonas yangmingensis]|uniref:Hpt domain-containing protein n=2 Tax=Halopseudomonas yangmingensis TaxID=1720063 RepID=A0A1I4N9E1_9GAMM|nr:Hpt domain-containing protein [Halopseudomonas yangmingensis]